MMTAGELARHALGSIMVRIWPRAACRVFAYHSWIGEPVTDHCKFCGIKC